jgi:hypothetical protein
VLDKITADEDKLVSVLRPLETVSERDELANVEEIKGKLVFEAEVKWLLFDE